MELCYLSLLCMVLNIKLSSAGTLPVYGKHHRVLYNDTSSLNINSRRFPDQDVIAPENFSYFFTDLSFRSGINGYILSGAADTLFQLDSNLNMVSNYEWERNSTLEEGCTRFNSPYLCKNYIRVLKKIPTHTNLLLVCGTIYDQIPQCRTIDISSGNLGNASNPVGAGDGLVTYFPDAAGFGEFIDIDGTENRFLSAVLQARNRDFVLSYQDVAFNDTTDPNTLQVSQLFKTRQNDDYWLRTPVTFVDYARVDYPQLRAPGDQDFYFVFLRETHTIFSSREPQEMIYSRVVRLCRNDPGSMSDNFFSNYIKARIFCQSRSPAENRTVNTLNYQYNAITSAKFNEEGRYYDTGLWNKKLYGAFISSSIGPRGTAICAYNANPLTMQGVYEAFRNVLDYTNRQNPMEVESNYLECSATSPRPDNIAGVQIESTHPITQIGENPLLIINDVTVTQILVDVKCVVTSADSTICRNQDILFLGTDRGKILKVVFATNDHQTRDIDPIIAEEIELDDGNAVNKMNMERIGTNDVIFAATDSKIYRIPLERCGRHGRTCSSCILSRDPYCVWNINSQQCEVSPFTLTGSGTSTVSSSYVQSIHSAATYPEIRFSEDVYVVTEANGMLTVTVVSNFSVSTNITLEITSSDGTARSGIDFEAVSRTLTIGPSQTQVTFDVTIRPNQVLDCSNRTFTLNMRGIGSTCVFVPDSQATVVIVDSNSMAIEFSSASYSMAEGDRFVNLTVERRIMNTMDVNFVISTESGSAVAPDDYSTLTASLLTFTANSGDGSITYTLPIVNDNLAEGDETFTVILALPSSINTCQDGGGITIGGISQAVVTILDDDYVYFGFESSSYTFSEGDRTRGIRITKFGFNAIPLNVAFTTKGNTAIQNDFNVTSSSNITFGKWDREYVINLTITQDNFFEGTESFFMTMMLSASSNSRVTVQRNSTEVYISDSSVLQIGFSSTVYTVMESRGSVQVTVTILNDISLNIPVSVHLQPSSCTAIAGIDFDGNAIPLTLDANGSSTFSANITIMDDDVLEASMEAFDITLAVNNSRIQVDPARSVARISIMDDDTNIFQFASRDYSIYESNCSVSLRIMRIGNSSIPVTLLLEISNITNTDYKYVQSRQQVVRFEPGEAYKEVDVSILVNTNENRNERFAASLLKDSNDERIVLNEWNTNVTILDDTYISCPTVTCSVPPTVRTFTTEALINVGGLEGDTSGSIYNSIGASVGVLIILLLIIVALAITVGILALFLCKKDNVIFKQKYNKKVIASPEDNPSKRKSPLPGDLELSTTYPNQSFCDCNSDSPPSGHNEMLEKTDLSSQKKEGETTEEDKSTFSTSHFLHVKRTSHELQHSDVSTTSSENSPPPDKNGSNTEVSSL